MLKISAKVEYACLALTDLAVHQPGGEPVPVKNIALAHGIPQQFLVQILLQLKVAGMVTSTRGASGGYRLIVAPEMISIANVLDAIDGSGRVHYDQDPSASEAVRSLRSVWQRVDDASFAMLQETTIADLVEQSQPATQPVVGDWI